MNQDVGFAVVLDGDGDRFRAELSKSWRLVGTARPMLRIAALLTPGWVRLATMGWAVHGQDLLPTYTPRALVGRLVRICGPTQ
jgi:hypothetical protein